MPRFRGFSLVGLYVVFMVISIHIVKFQGNSTNPHIKVSRSLLYTIGLVNDSATKCWAAATAQYEKLKIHQKSNQFHMVPNTQTSKVSTWMGDHRANTKDILKIKGPFRLSSLTSAFFSAIK